MPTQAPTSRRVSNRSNGRILAASAAAMSNPPPYLYRLTKERGAGGKARAVKLIASHRTESGCSRPSRARSRGKSPARRRRQPRERQRQSGRQSQLPTGCPEVAGKGSRCWRCLFARGDEHFLDVLPVHQMVEKCLQIVRSSIPIVNVVECSQTSQPRIGVAPCTSGFSPLGVLLTISLPSFTASQAQPSRIA